MKRYETTKATVVSKSILKINYYNSEFVRKFCFRYLIMFLRREN